MTLGNDRFFDQGAMRLALSLAGVAAPDVKSGCEIGAGGLSSAIAAAAHPGSDWRAAFEDSGRAAAIDDLAARAELALEVSAGIEAFCGRGDLPMFDFIGVSPNWSLLGETAQAAVLDLLARRLRPGGVFFTSYLVQPGSAQDTPLRVLGRALLRGATLDDADFDARFAAMLDEAEAALTSAPLMQTRHTDYMGRVAALRANPNPVAMWRRWFDPRCAPTTFLDFAGRMAGAGLEFAASADLANHAAEINFTPRQRAFLATIDDVATREQMADLISYTWGRADYWVKQPTRLDADARAKALHEMRLTLTRPAAEFDYRIKGMLGHVSLRREVYGPILAQLETTPGARLGALPGEPSVVAEAAALFVAAGAARASDTGEDPGVRDGCRRLNDALFADAAAGRAAVACASPVLRGGVDVSPRVMRFLSAWSAGARDAGDLARHCARMEAAAGVSADGGTIRVTHEANEFLAGFRGYAQLGVV